jgi:hypothetical protein
VRVEEITLEYHPYIFDRAWNPVKVLTVLKSSSISDGSCWFVYCVMM